MPDTPNAPSSSSNGNDGVGEPPYNSPPADSRNAATTPIFESGRIRWPYHHRLLYRTLITSFLISHSSLGSFDQDRVFPI